MLCAASLARSQSVVAADNVDGEEKDRAVLPALVLDEILETRFGALARHGKRLPAQRLRRSEEQPAQCLEALGGSNRRPPCGGNPPIRCRPACR